MKKIPIIGLMSGTSIDGIDVSFVYSDGVKLERTNLNALAPYQKKTIDLLEKSFQNPLKFIQNKSQLSLLNKLVTSDHANAVTKFTNKYKLKPLLIGFHGQTIIHEPKKFGSVQVGSGKELSRILKNNIVCDFRQKDIKFGGEGAPLAPVYHRYIIEEQKLKLPSIIINIGGISNISYWDGNTLLGFDTGPGNNLMDFYMKTKFKTLFDHNGFLASKGQIKYNFVENYLINSFFNTPPPKSLDRVDVFLPNIIDKMKDEKPEDIMATLSWLTVKSNLMALKFVPKVPLNCILVGGGQKNKYLVNLIKDNFPMNVFTAEELKIPGDYIEAELIAFLSARRLNNLYSTFPSTTGVSQNIIIGKLIKYK